MVADVRALQLAALLALTAYKRGCLRCRSLHAELVFNLAGSKHIGKKLDEFGISEAAKHLLLARFDATEEEMDSLHEKIQGKLASIEEHKALPDKDTLLKIFKITPQEMQLGSWQEATYSRIAVRDCQ